MNLKVFYKNINVMNILLILITYSLSLNIIAPLSASNDKIRLPSPKKNPVADLPKLLELPVYSYSDFLVIGETNLFHPERLIPAEKNTSSERRPEIILYGTIVSDGLRIAYLEEKRDVQSPPNVQATTGRDKRQRAMKLGQSVSGYVLKSIELDSVMFAKGEDKIILSIKDGKNRGRRAMVQEIGPYPPQRTPFTANISTLPINKTASPALPSFSPQNAQRTSNSASPPSKLELKRPVR